MLFTLVNRFKLHKHTHTHNSITNKLIILAKNDCILSSDNEYNKLKDNTIIGNIFINFECKWH